MNLTSYSEKLSTRAFQKMMSDSGIISIEAAGYFHLLQAEVEETLKRIQAYKGVTGVVVVSNEGIPIRTTLDRATTIHYACLISQLTTKARGVVKELDPTNEMTFLRIRTKKYEIMVAPDHDYILIVQQHPSSC